MYKATIYFDAVEDDYIDGETGAIDNSWTETLEAKTVEELREKVLEATYSKWEDLDDVQMNDYDFATEYHTSYMATGENDGQASDGAIALWKRGKLRLWAINCHILVSELTETKATL